MHSVLITIEIGVGLTGIGMFFMILGVLMLFDGGLIAIGNVSTQYLYAYE